MILLHPFHILSSHQSLGQNLFHHFYWPFFTEWPGILFRYRLKQVCSSECMSSKLSHLTFNTPAVFYHKYLKLKRLSNSTKQLCGYWWLIQLTSLSSLQIAFVIVKIIKISFSSALQSHLNLIMISYERMYKICFLFAKWICY